MRARNASAATSIASCATDRSCGPPAVSLHEQPDSSVGGGSIDRPVDELPVLVVPDVVPVVDVLDEEPPAPVVDPPVPPPVVLAPPAPVVEAPTPPASPAPPAPSRALPSTPLP